MPPPPINAIQFSMELISTVIIAVLTMIIFFKTKELAELTGKKSIKLFRFSFLFFGLAYIARLLMLSFKITIRLTELGRHFQEMNFFIFIPIVIFFSLVAIMALSASLMKRLQDQKRIILYICIIAFLASVIGLLSHALYILFLVELGLFIISFILIHLQNKTHIKIRRHHFQGIFVWLFFSWVMSLFTLIPPGLRIPYEFVIIPHLVSITIFVIILKKINKWVK